MTVSIPTANQENTKSSYIFWSDPSFWTLLAANAVTIVFAVAQGWSAFTLMMGFAIQSVIIGVFQFLRMINLNEFSVEGLEVSGVQKTTTDSKTKFSVAWFFAAHYGMFCLVHLGILTGLSYIANTPPEMIPGQIENHQAIYNNSLFHIDWQAVAIVSVIFFFNHLWSYLQTKPCIGYKPNIGYLMSEPYYRVLPMHLSIVLGVFVMGILPVNLQSLTLVLFLIFKGLLDIRSHTKKQVKLRPIFNV